MNNNQHSKSKTENTGETFSCGIVFLIFVILLFACMIKYLFFNN